MLVKVSASQKNVVLEKDFYSSVELKSMLQNRECCFFDDNFKECYSWEEFVYNFRTPILRVFLEKGDKLEVALNEDGMYYNVLKKQNGNSYVVRL